MKVSAKKVIATAITGLSLTSLSIYAIADDRDNLSANDISALSVSESKAVDIALQSLTGTVLGSELEMEEDLVLWQIEILDANNTEFLVDVDANTGEILHIKEEGKSDQDQSVISALSISQSQAVATALESIPGSVLGSELVEEMQPLVWQINIVNVNSVEFEVQIDSQSGAIISSKADD